jgi:deoxyribonuclease V
MGLWLGRPSIGVAKSRLYGRHGIVGPTPGHTTGLWDEKSPARIIGLLLRTQAGQDPIFISVGHLIDLDHAVQFVQRCVRGHRLPEPCRLAHEAAQGGRIPGRFGG